MTFEETLDQAIAMLQRRGRVTYRTLKRQFNLDDDALEDLKAEIIKGQRLAVDEDGAVLVWTGGAHTPPASLASPPPHQEWPHAAPHTRPTVSPVESRPPDAERRQLTVLFCDLVDSTALASQLDPEEWREVVQAYQATCAEVIARFEGHIAQYLGDGLLVYFGYPRAHEDDTHRAVRAGLGMIEALGPLNTRLDPNNGVQLAVRVGIHTGVVVVGEIGGGAKREALALGETPNLAARLQGRAAPNTVLISAATQRLIHGYFACRALGLPTLRGIISPVDVYRVLGESLAQRRLDVAATRGLTPLVGREQEVGLLRQRWAQVQDGLGQVVLLNGEAGIGKSRLVQVLKEHLADQPHARLEGRGSPSHQQSALYPVMEHLHRLLQWRHDETPHEKLRRLEGAVAPYGFSLPDVVPLLASLLSLPLPDRSPPLTQTPQRQKQKTLETLPVWLLEAAARQPVLVIIEELHWMDPSTLELLGLIIDQAPTARILTLLTCRPEVRPPWGFRADLTSLTLSRLPRSQADVMVERLAGGKTLPAEVRRQVVIKTDGVPLFVEELTKMVLESGWLREREDRYELTGPLPPLAIPATLHDSLMARLDRLATIKEVAQPGATLGRTFSYELLQAVAPWDEGTLQQALGRLVEAELWYQRGVPPRAIYLFKQALIQEAASQSLLRSTRPRYHRPIAQVLEARFPEIAEAQPELLAHHFGEAGLSEQAVNYWHQAGARAAERSATVEAISHLTKGVQGLQTLPDTLERTEKELAVQTALGSALMALRGQGAPEVEHVYTRARQLCQRVGDTPQLSWVLIGLWRFYNARGELQTAQALGEQLLTLAQRLQDSRLF
jgi:class 3 adenylate cyclase